MSFQHLNLNEVDPQGVPVPTGVPLKLEITEAGVKPYTDKVTGEERERIAFKFTVRDNPKFSGRNLYASIFEDKPEDEKQTSARRLRVLMDATGIKQTDDFNSWLTKLVSERAMFEAACKSGKDGRPEVNLWSARPA